MRIADRLAERQTFSFEIFPPKGELPLEEAYAIARELARSLTEDFGLPFIEPQPVVQGTVSTSGSPLRLRAYPSAAGQTIALMPNGAPVTVYGTWQGWNVVHYNGSVGYAAEAYIES